MSVFGVLNRADHNNKQSIPYDHGTGLHPAGHRVGTYYQMVARIARARRFPSTVAQGRLLKIELEDHPFPPGDPTQTNDPTRQNPVGLREGSTGTPDRISIAGIAGDGTPGSKFDGEHDIAALDFSPGLKSDRFLLLIDWVNDPADGDQTIEHEDLGWAYIAPTSKTEAPLVDPARVMSHPSFPQREGEGIYTYPYPPDLTRNFVYSPAVRLEGVIQRTIASNSFITNPIVDEDTIISEIWIGGDRVLSTLSEMYRVFSAYWTTKPDAGLALGWEPRDRTGDRYLIQIVNVSLGGLDVEYNEVRQFAERNRDSFLDRQLTVQFKLTRRVVPSRPKITMVGR